MPMDFDAARRRAHDELDAADTAARDRADAAAAAAAEKASHEWQALQLGREVAAALTAAGVPTMKKHVLVAGPRGADLVGWELGSQTQLPTVSFCTTDGVLHHHRGHFHEPLHDLDSRTFEPKRWAAITQEVEEAVGYRLAEHERNPPVPAPQPASKKRGLFGRKR
ncbi:hypothetical protein [Curtobacterium sp. MCBD17_030]|uniref:hypothetical protein n=1 Tax=Curtobacterium sp. MCBD17_030 TaxID=2175649 RepID=UPI0011B3705A|nr:hypothetical protein [Curtobacterium sp. MCBD17_030]